MCWRCSTRRWGLGCRGEYIFSIPLEGSDFRSSRIRSERRSSFDLSLTSPFALSPSVRCRSILQKHLKRQIISLNGGFQIISDLNTYHNFVSSLKQARVTEDFASLKMLGHVFIVRSSSSPPAFSLHEIDADTCLAFDSASFPSG